MNGKIEGDNRFLLRFWDKKNGRMIYPKDDAGYSFDFNTEGKFFASQEEDRGDGVKRRYFREPSEFERMQFSGRTDIKDLLAFEDDIIRTTIEQTIEDIEVTGTIVWDGSYFAVEFLSVTLPLDQIEDFEIIGNIYENPLECLEAVEKPSWKDDDERIGTIKSIENIKADAAGIVVLAGDPNFPAEWKEVLECAESIVNKGNDLLKDLNKGE